MLQCVAVCCSALQCIAACCSVLQCVAACCSVLQCPAAMHGSLPSRSGGVLSRGGNSENTPRARSWSETPRPRARLYGLREYCRQHTAEHCNTLQHTATHLREYYRHHTATLCNTLQHSATHGNTRQDIATHYNTPTGILSS